MVTREAAGQTAAWWQPHLFLLHPSIHPLLIIWFVIPLSHSIHPSSPPSTNACAGRTGRRTGGDRGTGGRGRQGTGKEGREGQRRRRRKEEGGRQGRQGETSLSLCLGLCMWQTAGMPLCGSGVGVTCRCPYPSILIFLHDMTTFMVGHAVWHSSFSGSARTSRHLCLSHFSSPFSLLLCMYAHSMCVITYIPLSV